MLLLQGLVLSVLVDCSCSDSREYWKYISSQSSSTNASLLNVIMLVGSFMIGSCIILLFQLLREKAIHPNRKAVMIVSPCIHA